MVRIKHYKLTLANIEYMYCLFVNPMKRRNILIPLDKMPEDLIKAVKEDKIIFRGRPLKTDLSSISDEFSMKIYDSALNA